MIEGPADLVASAEQRAYLTRGERWVVRPLAGTLQAVSERGARMQTREAIRVAADRDGLIQADGRTYRGTIVLARTVADRITAINVIDLEDYLLGVVPHEIGMRPEAELEAVKAQAIASRTYAIGHLGAREQHGFDFYATTQDQLYLGAAGEDPIATRAVRETRGEILTHQGLPILAYYSSTCGGETAAIEESWPWRAPLPYLKSVPDRDPATGRAWCETSNRFRWTTTWSRAQLLAVLGESLRAYAGTSITAADDVEAVERVSTGPSGRATVRLTTGASYTVRADSVRWVLRTAPGGAILNSSRIDEIDAMRSGGRLEQLTIRGGGWGHGVGMCQVGALGRARGGQTYTQILLAYYTNTELMKLY
ncbi:MAG: SpoIID/LytB domain-containing protein [Gemmatimonadetes bacterium]|nr:SpoIID/LytB domain-containing protein [Gemmatimonadota bacterium]